MAEKQETLNVDVEHNDGIASEEELARNAASSEHQRTFWQAMKKEKHSVFWSVAISSAIIMEGYDIVLVTSLFAQPVFVQRYGSLYPGGKWQISASWQSALGIAPTIGAIFGAFLNGWLTQKFGYRKVMLASLMAITAFIFLLFFAVSIPMILVGLILCGVPWGVFATVAPAYASEVCSLTLRGYLTIYVNLCWAIGQLIAAGVLDAFSTSKSQWAYRVPFAVQWAFPLPLAILVWYAPESPWWLVRKGRLDDATHALQRLSIDRHRGSSSAQSAIALIKHTNEIEDESQSGSSYLDCFRGVNLRRTEIACTVFAAQIWSGLPLGGTPAYFFVQAGLSSSNAFNFSVGGLGLASVGTIISWFLINRFGRRTLYVVGLGALSTVLLVVGIVAAISGSSSASFGQSGLIVAWLLIYYLTVGPVCYAIIAEVSAVRLRNKSVCLSRIAYYLSQVVGNVIEPYMINPEEGNWQGKTAFFWAGTCLLMFVWAWFRLPETGNRSYEELDILFESGASARKFKNMLVDPYSPMGERIKEK